MQTNEDEEQDDWAISAMLFSLKLFPPLDFAKKIVSAIYV